MHIAYMAICQQCEGNVVADTGEGRGAVAT